MKQAASVEAYIAQAPPAVRSSLRELRRTIKKAAPKAAEKMSYGMPFYEYGGSGYKGRLIYFAVFTKHIGVFIPPSLDAVPAAMAKYQTAKSSFKFPLDKPLPLAVIARTVKALMAKRNKELK
jgi:uncharacterized protein YdhG (YjbR/CyaY superfamily)